MIRRDVAAVLVLIAVVAAACGGPSSSSTTSTKAGSSAGSTVLVAERTTSLGKTLVDARGFTLYRLSTDGTDKSSCTAACTGIWPPLLATGTPSFGGLSGLSTFNRGGGKTQVAYHGEPLYTFSGDTKAGDTNGQGVTDTWGHWTAVVTSAASGGSSTTTSSTSGGGYGY
ncbi:MAG: COG4315 family predicted lipoprotein [Acidimicrobiales bacterium]